MAQTGEQSKQGFTKKDHAIRCGFCSTGKNESGVNIGGLIASQRVSCQIEPGKSVLVATIGRCINDGQWLPDGTKSNPCGRIFEVKMEFDGRRLNLSEDNIRACCQQSQGNLFELSELEAGQINIVDCPIFPKRAEAPTYDPNKFTEAEPVSF